MILTKQSHVVLPLVEVIFEVDKLVIAYIIQLRGIKDFNVGRRMWNRLLKGAYINEDKQFINDIQNGLREEYRTARKIETTIEKNWILYEKRILAWLKELTQVDFKTPKVKVCTVPFGAGQTPFRDIPLMIIGKIRKGWGYPETIAHELAHILFNQNFNFQSETEHPYVQLIEEEIAVRLGVRSKYFDYEIPAFADWVHRAQQREKAWRNYLRNIKDFRDISQFIRRNEACMR